MRRLAYSLRARVCKWVIRMLRQRFPRQSACVWKQVLPVRKHLKYQIQSDLPILTLQPQQSPTRQIIPADTSPQLMRPRNPPHPPHKPHRHPCSIHLRPHPPRRPQLHKHLRPDPPSLPSQPPTRPLARRIRRPIRRLLRRNASLLVPLQIPRHLAQHLPPLPRLKLRQQRPGSFLEYLQLIAHIPPQVASNSPFKYNSSDRNVNGSTSTIGSAG